MLYFRIRRNATSNNAILLIEIQVCCLFRNRQAPLDWISIKKIYDRKWIWILLQLCEELNWHDEHWICGIDMQNICILFNMNINSMLAWQDLKPCPRQDKSIVN